MGKGFSATAVAAIGEFVYTNRPSATVSQDNKDTLLAKDEIVYSKNLHVSAGPQSAYNFGLNYRSKNYWFLSLQGYHNFFCHFDKDQLKGPQH